MKKRKRKKTMDINKFVENLNKLSKVKVYEIEILKNTIEDRKRKIEQMQLEILEELEELGFNLNKYNDKEVAKVLGIPNLNRATIKEQITSTGKNVFRLINELKTLNTEIQGYENLLKNVDGQGFVHPKFGVNEAGFIKVAEPALAKLSDYAIAKLLGFSHYKKFDTFDNLCAFIRRYKDLFGRRVDNQNSFIVVGITLFYHLCKVELWDITEAYLDKYKELYKVPDDLEHKEWMKAMDRHNAGMKFVTGQTYKIFDKVYTGLFPLIEISKVAISEGLIEGDWFGFFRLDDLIEEAFDTEKELKAEQNKWIEDHMYGVKIREEIFYNLYNQYVELKAMADKGEDISRITKDDEVQAEIRAKYRAKLISRKLSEKCGGICPRPENIHKYNVDMEALLKEVKEELNKKFAVKAEIKHEEKNETPVVPVEEVNDTKPVKAIEYDLEKNRETMRSYGWSEEIIEKNIAEIQATEIRLNDNYNSPDFVICAEQNTDEVYDFLIAGRQQIRASRMIFDSKTEEGDVIYDLYVRVKDIRHTIKVKAVKGTAHRTLEVTLPDGRVQTYQATNKKHNIKQMTVDVLNTLC